jgi:hypothetical protein
MSVKQRFRPPLPSSITAAAGAAVWAPGTHMASLSADEMLSPALRRLRRISAFMNSPLPFWSHFLSMLSNDLESSASKTCPSCTRIDGAGAEPIIDSACARSWEARSTSSSTVGGSTSFFSSRLPHVGTGGDCHSPLVEGRNERRDARAGVTEPNGSGHSLCVLRGVQIEVREKVIPARSSLVHVSRVVVCLASLRRPVEAAAARSVEVARVLSRYHLRAPDGSGPAPTPGASEEETPNKF